MIDLIEIFAISIKFIGARGNVDILLNEQQQQQMLQAINCIVTEGKTLL